MSGRIRSIKPELLEDKRTATLSHEAWRLFVSALVLADDYGNLRAEPTQIQGAVFWGRPCKDVAGVLAELYEMGLLTPYEVRGQSYAHVTNWDKHQRVDHPGKPRVPGVPENLATVSRESRESLAPDLRPPISDLRPRPPSIGQATARPKQSNGVTTPEAREVHAYWQEVFSYQGRGLTRDRAKFIQARLAEGATVEHLKRAVDGCKADAWDMGANPEGRLYNECENIFRNAARVDKLAAQAKPAYREPRTGKCRVCGRPTTGPDSSRCQEHYREGI